MIFINMLISSIISYSANAWNNLTSSNWESINTNWEDID